MLTLMEFNKIFGINNCELPTVRNQKAHIYILRCVKTLHNGKPYKCRIYEPYKLGYPSKILSVSSIVYDDDGYNSWFSIQFNAIPDENGVFYYSDFFKTKKECQIECDKRNKEELEKSDKYKKYKPVEPTEIKQNIKDNVYEFKYNIGDIVRFIYDEKYHIGIICGITSNNQVDIAHFGKGVFHDCDEKYCVEVLQPSNKQIMDLLKSHSRYIRYEIYGNHKSIQKFLNKFIHSYNKEQEKVLQNE